MSFRISQGNGLEQVVELAAGYGIGGAVSTALEPLLRVLSNAAWTEAPHMPADVGTVARLLLLELIDDQAAQDEAANTGYNETRLRRYVEALQAPPGTAEILELYRRGELALEAAASWLRRGGLDGRLVEEMLTLARTYLSPAEAAMARQQSFLTREQQYEVAAIAGVAADDAEVQFEISGEPPGPQEMIELLRRGKVTEDRVRQAIVEGRIKLKYVDDVLALREVPLSPAIAAEAVVRERHLPRDPHYYAAAAGISTEDFDAWVQMLGRPIAIGEALTVINRGKYGSHDSPAAKAFFREAVARSDIRTEYTDDLYELRLRYPPLFQVQRALESGTITPAIARDTLTKEGYPPEWVDAIVTAHAGGKKAKSRDLSAAIIDTLYEAGLYTHPEAETALEALGYDQAEAEHYLDLWLARRIVSDLVRALGVIERRYVGWKIDKVQAQTLLAELAIPGDAGERFMATWDAEREANAPTLTASEVERGFHYGRFDFEAAMAILQRMGYTLDDALTKLWITVHGDPRPASAP